MTLFLSLKQYKASPRRGLGRGNGRWLVDRLADDVEDVRGRGHQRRMVDRMRPQPSLHPLGHEALIFLDDHAVLLGDEEPRRPVLPQRPAYPDGDAGGRNRPLDRSQHRQLFLGSVLREGGGESRLWQIDQPMRVRRELGRLRMRLAAREHVRDRLAFVGGERGHIDERLHLLAAGRADDGAGIGVGDEHGRPGYALERPVERRDIVGERCQRQRRRDRFDAARRQRRDHLRPARSVSPGAMDKHHAHIVRGHRYPPCCPVTASPLRRPSVLGPQLESRHSTASDLRRRPCPKQERQDRHGCRYCGGRSGCATTGQLMIASVGLRPPT